MLALLDFALGSARRRLFRHLAIGVALTVVVSAFASILFITDSLRREFSLGIEGTPDLTVQRLVAGRPALISIDAAEVARSHPGVRSVMPRVWGYAFIASLAANITIVSTNEDLGDEEAVIGRVLADSLGLRVGDRFAVPGHSGPRSLGIKEIFDDPSALRSADVVLVTQATARALLGVADDQAVDLAITLSSESEAPALTRLLRETIPGARVLERNAMKRTYDLTFSGRAGWMSAALLPALLTLLLIGWERLTGLSPEERREIGVLKAVGFSTRDVIVARLMENAWVAFIFGALGLLVAYLYVYALGAPVLAGTLFGWSSLFPRFELVPVFDVTQLVTLLALIVVPFSAVAVVPTWRVAILDVDTALRGSS